MSIDHERFEQGMTYAEYKAQMTRNRERLEENERAVALAADDLAFFKNLPQPVHVLALVEDWCGDVINNLPVLALMAEGSGKLDLRIFLRDQNLDLIDQYLKEGKYRSIPVFAFFDADFQPIGHWIERPALISQLMGELRRELFTSDEVLKEIDPDTQIGDLSEAARNRLMAGFAAFRKEHRTLADREVLREIRILLGDTAKPAEAVPSRMEELRRRAQAAQQRATNPLKVTITYCAVCGYEPQTLELTDALMRAFIYDLSAIELVPWQDGTFDVAIDGEVVHSMIRDGGFPEPQAIVAAVRERLVPAA